MEVSTVTAATSPVRKGGELGESPPCPRHGFMPCERASKEEEGVAFPAPTVHYLPQDDVVITTRERPSRTLHSSQARAPFIKGLPRGPSSTSSPPNRSPGSSWEKR